MPLCVDTAQHALKAEFLQYPKIPATTPNFRQKKSAAILTTTYRFFPIAAPLHSSSTTPVMR